MPECAKDGCTQAARHTVTFEDPADEVGYCLNCAVYEYRTQSTAVAVAEGI